MNPIINQQHHWVIMPSTSHTQSPMNLPYADLLADGSRERYNEICVPLYDATITSDWEGASKIFDKYWELRELRELVQCSITESYETILHIAVLAKKNKMGELFVENLVRLMERKDLELQNKNGKTALFLAVEAGNVKMVDIMVKKNRAVLDIPDGQGMMPLYTAALHGSHSMTEYLYGKSESMNGYPWTHESRGSVLLACAEAELFDIALKIVIKHPSLDIKSLLRVLALKTDAFNGKKTYTYTAKDMLKANMEFFGMGKKLAAKEHQAMILLRKIWSEILKLPKAEVDGILRGSTKYSSSVLFVAAEMGNTAFVFELIRRYPGLVWEVNDNNQSIFHIAVLHRHASLYKLIYEIGMFNDSIITLEDKNGDNMLHLVGHFGEHAQKNIAQDKPGIVLQLQREVLWFKEVEVILPPSFKQKKNKDGLTPDRLFNSKHSHMISEGEKWLKETAAQLMVVAALIAAITFSAAITFPGGYNQDSGNPVFLKKKSFTVFLLFDAFSFLSALASILSVLAILTSHYTADSFLRNLPNHLVFGISTLIISVTSMFIAFGLNFFLLYENNRKVIPIVIIALLYFVFGLTGQMMMTHLRGYMSNYTIISKLYS